MIQDLKKALGLSRREDGLGELRKALKKNYDSLDELKKVLASKPDPLVDLRNALTKSTEHSNTDFTDSFFDQEDEEDDFDSDEGPGEGDGIIVRLSIKDGKVRLINQ
jgi:hypothetical protein